MAERRAEGPREPIRADRRRGRVGVLAAWAVEATRSAATRAAELGTALAYRRGELVAVALLAGSLVGGAAVEGWRLHHPDAATRLEAEPPRLAPAARGRPADHGPGRDAGRRGLARSSRARPEAGRAPRIAAEQPCPPTGRVRARAIGPESEEASAPAAPSPDHPLDLNRATLAELTQLPGIGPRLAERIVRHRAMVGGYRSADDLGGVPGLGGRRAAALRLLVTLTPELGDGRDRTNDLPQEPIPPAPVDPGPVAPFSHPTEDERWERPLRGDTRRPSIAAPDRPDDG